MIKDFFQGCGFMILFILSLVAIFIPIAIIGIVAHSAIIAGYGIAVYSIIGLIVLGGVLFALDTTEVKE